MLKRKGSVLLVNTDYHGYVYISIGSSIYMHMIYFKLKLGLWSCLCVTTPGNNCALMSTNNFFFKKGLLGVFNFLFTW